MKTRFLLLALLLSAASVRADTFYPMLMSIDPVAVQAGATAECEIAARYDLDGAYQVFISGTGVTGEVVPPPKPAEPKKNVPQSKIKVRFKADAGALPGPRDVRVATPLGVSTVGQIVVVTDPIIREAANNDTMKTAQPITLPAAVCGTIEKVEDVDYYKFNVAANTALTFHVWSQRLQNRIHDLQEHSDPIITLKNSAGTVLAANDNYFAGDPLMHYRFATAGEYYLEIRDARYGGNRDWKYCIEINDRPFVTTIHPLRLTPGVSTKVQMVGFNLPADPSVTYTLPADAAEASGRVVFTLADGRKTNSVPIAVSKLPEVLEAAGDHATPATAQKVGVPAGICGRIDKENEVDCYSFEAKAGERFSFEVEAHAHQSGLDSIVRILNDKGQRLIENDDFYERRVNADSRIENWSAPANGRYTIEIRDLHDRGGPAFTYLLKITRAEPQFVLDMDTDKTLLAPGINGVIFVRAVRKNGFQGEIALGIDGLPPGVTASCGKIPAGAVDGSILLRAANDAPRGAANIRITGTATHTEMSQSAAAPGSLPIKPVTLAAVARPLQEIYMPGGGRWHYPVDFHTVSVGAPLDIRSVKITPNAIVLKPGESRKVEITIERAPDFKGNVTLDAVYQHLSGIFGNSLPPGITIDDKAGKTLLPAGQSQGYLTLKAAADAKPIENHQAIIMAHVSINFVMKFTYCGEPLMITIAK
jgi:hypothetical protein